LSSDKVTVSVLPELQELLANRQVKTLDDAGRKPASVLLLVYENNGEHFIHLQKRPQHVHRHKGEVCFPGGVPESNDDGPLATALREAFEEDGIHPGDVTILGQMDDFPTRTDYTLKVFVGTIPYPYDFQSNPDEVEELLEVPLKALRDPANLREEVRWQKDGPVTTYSYAYGPHITYGAMAHIVTQFLKLIDEAQKNWRT